MIHRTMTFDGTDLVNDLGLVYSSFSETLPVPKVNLVEIPYGTDIDITEALGPVAYGNGTHVLTFLVYGDTEAARLQRKDAAIALLHGKMATYTLSWQQGVTYTGRAKVDVTHLSETADVLTVTISRSPDVGTV